MDELMLAGEVDFVVVGFPWGDMFLKSSRLKTTRSSWTDRDATKLSTGHFEVERVEWTTFVLFEQEYCILGTTKKAYEPQQCLGFLFNRVILLVSLQAREFDIIFTTNHFLPSLN
jgi:hypothetical protein